MAAPLPARVPVETPPDAGGEVAVAVASAAPIDVARTVRSLRHGPRDPAFRADGAGGIWRACHTPAGPATVHIGAWDVGAAQVPVRCWGPGAHWVGERATDLVGADDRGLVVDPMHPRLREAARRYRHVRIGRTHLVVDALVPAIIEQKVTSVEAFQSWRQLLLRFGAPAPGPAPDGLRVPPGARAWALVPSWEWHRAGVGPERAATVVRAVRAADRLEAAGAAGPDALDRALRTIPGIGAWTSSEVRQRALGDPDAVSVGDYHVAKDVGYMLTGERTDDAGMLRLLQPWAGNRYRVIRLIELAGVHAPRRGPRTTIYDYRGI